MYRVLIDELVLEEDFKRIDQKAQKRIVRAIREKLAVAPKEFGKPLKGDLKGLWRLRVGQYRVVYEIKEKVVVVYVIKVGLRRDTEVYRELVKRLEHL